MNELTIKTDQFELMELPKNYQVMLKNIDDHYPDIAKTSKNFHKHQSQFMDFMMAVHQPTTIRSLRQLTAEIERGKMALESNQYKIAIKRLRAKQNRAKMDAEEDPIQKQILQLKADQVDTSYYSTMNYVTAMIRRVSALITQYNNMCEKYGKTVFNEQEFEEDEERYHIMTAFSQGLTAARAHNGTIDEGNHIYFMQIGINGSAAQYEIGMFMSKEADMNVRHSRNKNGNELPSHEMITDWLDEMAEKYEGCAAAYATRGGKKLIAYESLNTEEEDGS